ncbi:MULTISPECIES: hypothetical protein [Acinetobacter]|jgi:hypothetical protein|nr:MULTISPECIES: hypothetical protein [Acinetobacter]
MHKLDLQSEQLSKHTALAMIGGLSLLYIGFMLSFALLFSWVF